MIAQMSDNKRIVFLDYLRVIACFMVMVVHACECFYFGGDGGLHYDSAGDAFWATWIDSAVRACVPLFVIASSYLLFPVTKPTGEFFKRRLVRVVVPFVIWCALYVWRFDGKPIDCLFNFPMATGGHLWFVPMLLGLYILMPLLSPWAEKASEKEVRGCLILWLSRRHSRSSASFADCGVGRRPMVSRLISTESARGTSSARSSS